MANGYNCKGLEEFYGDLNLDRRLNTSFTYDSNGRIVQDDFVKPKLSKERVKDGQLAFSFEV